MILIWGLRNAIMFIKVLVEKKPREWLSTSICCQKGKADLTRNCNAKDKWNAKAETNKKYANVERLQRSKSTKMPKMLIGDSQRPARML
jgi:hypothetical protein